MGNALKSAPKDQNHASYRKFQLENIDYDPHSGKASQISPPPPPIPTPSYRSTSPLSPTSSLTGQPENLQSYDEIYKLENPGTIEDIHKECKDVMPVFFEGARVIFTRCLSNHFQISHTLRLMSDRGTSCYRFGATYVGGKGTSIQDSYPILLGEIERSGNLQANILHGFNKIRMKTGVEFQGNTVANCQIVTDYIGEAFSASLVLSNINLKNSSGIIVGQYLQSLTRNLALGGELGYQFGQFLPSGYLTLFHLASRYKSDTSIISAVVGGSGLHLSYFKQASPQLKIGVEFSSNFDVRGTSTAIGYQIDLPKADLVFRGTVDTNCNICSVLEKRLKPMPFTFSLSGLLNQKTGQFKMGCGFVIG